MTTAGGSNPIDSITEPPRSARLTWLVLWQWAGDHARVDQPIAAVLPRRLGHENVQRIVQALYAAREYTPAEMIEAAGDRGHNPYRAHLGSAPLIREDGAPGSVEWQGEILCGHNPYLVARHARVWLEHDEVRYEWAYERPRLDLRGYRSDAMPLEPPR